MQYGYFDDTNREYVITNPKTPVKWINYVGTLAFGGLIDHTGGALICRGDPALNRITKYIPQLPAGDFKGTTLYLRTQSDGAYRVFSPFFVPTLDRYDHYECHIGLGYTRVISEFYGIRTQATFFVPIDEERLILDVCVTNLTDKSLELDAIPVMEYSHFEALKQFTNADWVPQTMQSRVFQPEAGRTILTQYAFMRRDTHINYLTSNQPVSSFESDRKQFLGDNEYGTWTHPLGLQEPELSSSEALRGDNIGALLHHLGELKAGESKRLIVQIGQVDNLDSALPGIRRYWDERAVDEAFTTLATFWENYLSVFQVETSDASMNSMLNVHHPRQCHTTKNWSRYLSLYQLGLGARGIGFRDSSQDILGIMAHIPQEGQAFIRQLLSTQRRDGSAMHQFFPLTMEANEGDAREIEDRPNYYSDDHLWIILAICAYLKETGDIAFLDEVMPYYDRDRHEQPIESGAVRDHIQRGIDFTRSHVGTHGLPLLGFADWNDTVNLRTGAESLFTANLYGTALQNLIELFTYLGDETAVAQCVSYYDEMKQRVNDHAWDGDWYVRYFDYDGQPIGSRQNPAGKIYTNAQSWSVISGYATPVRAREALEAVFEHLNTPNGIKLSMPGYDGYDPNIGGISTYPPGAKENGGIFLHTNPWVMIAETMMGNGDRAYAYYCQINPAAKNDRIDEYECEPYVYAQNILGDEHPQFGLARNSWLSGTSAWVYQAATQYILGIVPTYTGLRIDPCIPKAWDGFTVTRQFRGATYRICVKNPNHVSKGIQAVWVDGLEHAGNSIPVYDDDQHHEVEVMMG